MGARSIGVTRGLIYPWPRMLLGITVIARTILAEGGPSYSSSPDQLRSTPPRELTAGQAEYVNEIIARINRLRSKSRRQYRRYQITIIASLVLGLSVPVSIASKSPIWVQLTLSVLIVASQACLMVLRDQELSINAQGAADCYEFELTKLQVPRDNYTSMHNRFATFFDECERIRKEYREKSMGIALQRPPLPGPTNMNGYKGT